MDINDAILSKNISPIIYGTEVFFIYKGQAESVYLAGDYNCWELEDKMEKYHNSEVWFIKKVFPTNARFDYKYIVDSKWVTDPLNEKKSLGGVDYNSTLIMPQYKSDYQKIINHTSPEGLIVKDLKIKSSCLKADMNYHIYLPTDYKKNNSYHVLYALDGSDYLNYANINLILDYLIKNKYIPRLVGVLVDPYERDQDYTIYKPYFDFVTKELIPSVENKYLNTTEIKRIDRAVIGVSWGGLTAIYLAVNKRFLFNRVLSQSGSFWPKDWLIYNMVAMATTPLIRFCLQTGTIKDTEEMNDAMAEILTKKGYQVEYAKYAETHSWFNWKGHLDEGLRELYVW